MSGPSQVYRTEYEKLGTFADRQLFLEAGGLIRVGSFGFFFHISRRCPPGVREQVLFVESFAAHSARDVISAVIGTTGYRFVCKTGPTYLIEVGCCRVVPEADA